MSAPTRPLRWRRVDFRVFRRKEARHELRRGAEVVANVRKGADGWYWTAIGSPTPAFPGSLAACKDAARAAVLALETEGEG